MIHTVAIVQYSLHVTVTREKKNKRAMIDNLLEKITTSAKKKCKLLISYYQVTEKEQIN